MRKYIVLLFLTICTGGASAPFVQNNLPKDVLMAMEKVVDVASENQDAFFFYVYTAVLWQESRWKQNTLNHNTDGSYDYGIAQLNSRYFPMWKDYDGWDIRTTWGNAYVGAKHFQYLVKTYKGDYYKALLAYNCGMGNVARNTVPKVTHIYARRILLNAKMNEGKPALNMGKERR